MSSHLSYLDICLLHASGWILRSGFIAVRMQVYLYQVSTPHNITDASESSPEFDQVLSGHV